jgi:hypothetical protein
VVRLADKAAAAARREGGAGEARRSDTGLGSRRRVAFASSHGNGRMGLSALPTPAIAPAALHGCEDLGFVTTAWGPGTRGRPAGRQQVSFRGELGVCLDDM